jgi:hypothetical protein
MLGISRPRRSSPPLRSRDAVVVPPSWPPEAAERKSSADRPDKRPDEFEMTRSTPNLT